MTSPNPLMARSDKRHTRSTWVMRATSTLALALALVIASALWNLPHG